MKELQMFGVELKDLFNKYNIESIKTGEIKIENGSLRFKDCSIRESVTIVNDFIINEDPDLIEEGRPVHEEIL